MTLSFASRLLAGLLLAAALMIATPATSQISASSSVAGVDVRNEIADVQYANTQTMVLSKENRILHSWVF